MKKYNYILYTISLLLSSLLLLSETHALDTGDVIPDIKVKDLYTDHSAKLSDNNAKLIYLDFWASWCGTCKKTLPFMNELQKKFGEQGLKIIALSVDTKLEDAKHALSAVKPVFQVGSDLDGKIAEQFSPPSMPTAFLIKDGKIVSIHEGFGCDDGDKIEAEIKKLL